VQIPEEAAQRTVEDRQEGEERMRPVRGLEREPGPPPQRAEALKKVRRKDRQTQNSVWERRREEREEQRECMERARKPQEARWGRGEREERLVLQLHHRCAARCRHRQQRSVRQFPGFLALASRRLQADRQADVEALRQRPERKEKEELAAQAPGEAGFRVKKAMEGQIQARGLLIRGGSPLRLFPFHPQGAQWLADRKARIHLQKERAWAG